MGFDAICDVDEPPLICTFFVRRIEVIGAHPHYFTREGEARKYETKGTDN